jgi:phage N-6-adenine-methyltransferase
MNVDVSDLLGEPPGTSVVVLEKSNPKNVHFSSGSELWATPADFFNKYDAIYSFDLDVCALPGNAKCAEFFTPEIDGLTQDWAPHTCWMNPPYGREIGAWMRKAYIESQKGATVVCLVPSRTDTAWWHDYAMKGEIEFIRGRLKFGGSPNSAPFPNAVVVFRPADDLLQELRDKNNG